MKNKLLFSVLVIAMLVLAACNGQAASPTENAGAQPQNTTAAPSTSQPSASTSAPAMPVLLDPALATSADAKTAISHVYEGLVRTDNNNSMVAALATNITPSQDNLDYVVTLRTGVTFHDGTALNADAVVMNFNRWFDPKNPLHGSGTYDTWVANFGGFKGDTDANGKPKSEFDGIEKQNDTTVILHLNTPDPNLSTKLSDPAFSIVSPAALQAAGFGTPSGKDGGSGPYKIGTWNNSGLTLDPFSSYWDATAIPGSSINVTLGP